MLETFMTAHGGAIASIILIVGGFNILMSAVTQVFQLMNKQEPGWLQTAGSWGLKITQWLSANTPTKPNA